MTARRKLDPAADRGTTGPAMLARRAALTVIEDDTAAEDGSRRFTRTEVLRVSDGVIDFYAARGVLTGRRLAAAIELSRLYASGRIAPTGCRVSGGNGGGEMSDERAEAWRVYKEALATIPYLCQRACDAVASDRHPNDPNAVQHMRVGFAALADLWREPEDQ